MRSRFCIVGCLLLTGVSATFAQRPEQIPEFDAVSIKLSTGADHGPPGSDGGPGTRYPSWFGANATIRSLIFRAYGLTDPQKQISGPSWIDGQQFAIDARVPPGTTKQQFQKMLQKVLAERFGFVAHRETTLMSVLELTVAKNGPKLKAGGSTPDSETPGLTGSYGPGGAAHLKGRQQTMASLAGQLGAPTAAGRTVIDKTGLTGKYDFTLDYELNMSAGSTPGELGFGVFDAVQRQLGLKLVEAKQNVDLIVIDHVEKMPTEN